jgi:glutamate---cysteine ligase / carboxylate-amine ligase
VSGPFRLFEVVGLELEYMLVSRDDLRVKPIADRLLDTQPGGKEGEVILGRIAWSNELALHVVEMKTAGPAPSFTGLADSFQESVLCINGLLEPMGAQLMPTAMHPTMDPTREARLWPHAYGPVYQTFDRIFDCRGHGWTNLQSMHINLPFADDAEFALLHAATRFVLPLLPALCASSPLCDGAPTGWLDSRLWHYGRNSRRFPSIAGQVIPEPLYTRAAYESELLGRIYSDLAPHDPDGVLRHEWANARGCIARFERGAIEIRILDLSECPRSDMAIAETIVALIRALCEGHFAPQEELRGFGTDDLAALYQRSIHDADRALVDDAGFLRALSFPGARCETRELWLHLLERLPDAHLSSSARALVRRIVNAGCLSRRILAHLSSAPRREEIDEVYRELCACLAKGEPFDVAS